MKSCGEPTQYYMDDNGQVVCRFCGRLMCDHGTGISHHGIMGNVTISDPPMWRMTTTEGWECPRCHRVYGPQVTECKACRQCEPSLEE